MDFEWIKLFLMLAEYESFSEVAEQNYTSQSSVSKKIKKLEEQIGAPLFERTAKGTQLSNEGKIFYDYAQKMMGLYHQGMNAISQESNPHHKALTIGSTSLYGEHLLAPLIHQYQQIYPDQTIHIQINHSQETVDQLNQGKIDLAIVSGYIPYDRQLFDSYLLGRDHFMLAVPKNHRFKAQTKVRLGDLKNETFIVKGRDSALYHHIAKQIKSVNPDFKVEKMQAINHQNTILSAVSYGLGVAIISQLALEKNQFQDSIHTLEIEDVQLYREVICLFPQKLAPYQAHLIHFLKENHPRILANPIQEP